MKSLVIDKDAFSQGQVLSKIWLCEELEKVNLFTNSKIWVLGGWHGVLSFLLLSRGIVDIKEIRSFDVDPVCEPIADVINNTWVTDNWRFKAITHDCNELDYADKPNIVINTSTEHFTSTKWFDSIPKGTLVCLQGNNLNHDDHFSQVEDFSEFLKLYKFSNIMFQGEKDFSYPDFKFTRYMIIGIK
jgi:hypothetical protein